MEIKIVGCIPKVKVTKQDLIDLYYMGRYDPQADDIIKILSLSKEQIQRVEAWINKGIMEYEDRIEDEIFGDE